MINIAVSKSDIEKLNKFTDKFSKTYKKNMHSAMKRARIDAIKEIKEKLDDHFNTYSVNGDASRHFKFKKTQHIAGNESVFMLGIEPADDVGNFLMFGTSEHLITANEKDNLVFTFDDGSRFIGPEVMHPGIENSVVDIEIMGIQSMRRYGSMIGKTYKFNGIVFQSEPRDEEDDSL